jgi:hypothetical protein
MPCTDSVLIYKLDPDTNSCNEVNAIIESYYDNDIEPLVAAAELSNLKARLQSVIQNLLWLKMLLVYGR